MYDNIGSFTGGYNKSKQLAVQGDAVPAGTAYIIYDKTRNNPAQCLVAGRHTDSNGNTTSNHYEIAASGAYAKGCGINWFGDGGLQANENTPTGVSGAKDMVAQNFGVTAESSGPGDKFIGAILAAGGWNYAVNDAWVLGGVHGMLPVYCASALTKDNMISARRNALTITGREVLGLLTFGYKMVSHAKLGMAFQCEDWRAAKAASFEQYDAAGEKYNEGKAAIEFFNSHGMNI